jgi:WD40 repeat protein
MNFIAVASNAHCSDEKGTIDVWNLREMKTQHQQQYYQDHDDSWMTESSFTRIEAHDDNQKIRGLRFVTVDNGFPFPESDGPVHWIVSCTLQGEVKFFKYDENDGYACTHKFQSPGKIFSMAISTPSFSSKLSPTSDAPKMYLAVGQSRGQVRVWKVNLLKDDGNDHNNEQHQLERKVIDSSKSVTSTAETNGDDSSSASKTDILQDFLSTSVGEHMHHDNIKFLSFTPDGRHLVASRAYDGRIWFQSCRHS